MSAGPNNQAGPAHPPAAAGASLKRALLHCVLGFCLLLGGALLLAWASMAT